jgi:hypothetical protein
MLSEDRLPELTRLDQVQGIPPIRSIIPGPESSGIHPFASVQKNAVRVLQDTVRFLRG